MDEKTTFDVIVSFEAEPPAYYGNISRAEHERRVKESEIYKKSQEVELFVGRQAVDSGYGGGVRNMTWECDTFDEAVSLRKKIAEKFPTYSVRVRE